MKMLLTLTLSGSVLALLLMALRYIVLRRMPSTVYYYAWLPVLLRLALPLPGLVPSEAEAIPSPSVLVGSSYVQDADGPLSEQAIPDSVPNAFPTVPFPAQAPSEISPASEAPETPENAASAESRFSVSWRSPKLWLSVWTLGTVLSLGLTVTAYLRFTLSLRRKLQPPNRFIRTVYASIPGHKPRLFLSGSVNTPLMFGLLSPRIVLPEQAYDEELLRNILRHELMHYRRMDTLYKWVAVLVLSAHWFNPLSWLIRKELSRACELSCDELLLRSMSREEKRSYGHTLLAMAAASALPAGVVATTFSTQKRNLKERLEQIMHYKKSKARVLAAVLTLVLLAGCGLAAGPQATTAADSAPAPVIPEGAVRVTNVDEFLAAIGPNTTIYLEAGEYDLSKASDYAAESKNPCYFWKPVWEDGANKPSAELVISRVKNLTILGQGTEETSLVAVPRYANVLCFDGCTDLTLQNLTAGHSTQPGICSGGVLQLENCQRVSVDSCDLYGCGTVGVDASNTNDLSVTGCQIYECSSNAVSLQQCYSVHIEDCDVFRLGARAGQGSSMALFTASYSNDVVIRRNSIHDNNAQFLLQLRYTQNASFLSNEVRSNRFDNGVFQFEQYGATVDGCSFADNGEIRSWVQSSGVYAHDASGKLLDVSDFVGMRLREIEPGTEATPAPIPAAVDVAPGGSIEVRTVDEFLAAIGPDRTIVLDGDVFDLSQASNYGSVGGQYYYWNQSHDGPELVIQDVSGLTIHPKAAYPEATTLAAIPRYANVLNFRSCHDLMLVGFTAGHTREPGSCSGGVLNFQNCSNVRLDGMRLYGCGILGVQASYSTGLDIWRTEIYECSQGAAQFYQCDGLHFNDCYIHDVPSPAFTFTESGDISWNGSEINRLSDHYNVKADGELEPYVQEPFAANYQGEYPSFTFAEDSEEMAFMASVQKTIADGDWETLADQVKYPLQIVGEDYYVRILNREQFLEAADSVFNLFNPDFREIIAKAPLEEFGGTIYGITFCNHLLAFSNFAVTPGGKDYRVSMISLSDPLWPIYAYAFLGGAPTPEA
ncbi:MAG: right-handed parallel beta-helix repeat-containing protein [Oscillospiraceae bacterium]|nr:right-handed parallel beta-helix repeat-containing protein [Oscillospiraceae bacterium]